MIVRRVLAGIALTASGAALATQPLPADCFASDPPPARIDCFVQCNSGNCEVGPPSNAQPAPTSRCIRTLAKTERPLLVEACGDATLRSDGVLVGLFMSPRGLERFKVASAHQPFAKLVPALSKGVCTGSPQCAEQRDRARVAAVGGKGIDGVASRRVGSPCALGLPCGAVLRPGGALAFDVQGGPASGRLRLIALRGGNGERVVAMSDRRISLPAGSLQPGAAYAYSLFDAAGTEVAAGEFSVLSGKMQADVEADLAVLSSLDAIGVLLDNDLQWDAMRQTR